MEFRTGNIEVEFSSEELENIEKVKTIISDFRSNMEQVKKSYAGWSDGYGGAGELSPEDFKVLEFLLERFMYIDEVY